MTDSEDSIKAFLRKTPEELERLFGHPFPQTEEEERLICRVMNLEVALNYFLMRDTDKPQNWRYGRDEAEKMARDWLGNVKPIFPGAGFQVKAEGDKK